MSTDAIVVRGARVHNLKNIDFEVPHNCLTVVTGVSGSGKSSLAFDTIYAEGQRRYVESLSAYARQFLERIEKPDADVIDGIAPAVAIRQKNQTRNPRSTVATATEIYDYLRLLYARIGRTYCPKCGEEVRSDTVDEIAARILELGDGTRIQAMFPLMHADGPSSGDPVSANIGKKSGTLDKNEKKTRGRRKKQPEAADAGLALRERLFELRKRGFNRLLQEGELFEFSTPESLLEIDFSRPVFILLDRIVVDAESRSRIVDAIESGYRESGEVLFETAPSEGEPQRLRFSQSFECKRCHLKFEQPEPRLFSFNNPYGACPRCQGFGNTIDFDMALVIPDPARTLADGAVEPWTKPKYRPFGAEMRRAARMEGVPLDVPWRNLTPAQQRFILEGNDGWGGVRGFFEYLERKKYKLHVRVFLSRYRGYSLCGVCGGARLRPEARQIRIADIDICRLCRMTVEQAASFFRTLVLTEQEAGIAGKLLEEIGERLRFLNDVGLEYLTLDRLASSLSGGEAQRIQLATSLGSRLVGTLYVLDEPSIGLHSRDTARLIHILRSLRDMGNTILVVEHDAEVMAAADEILDLGPGAGEHGGKLVARGSYEQVRGNRESLTGRYLSGDLRIQLPQQRRAPGKQLLKLRGARGHNLKDIDVTIPLGMFVAVTGVSGSGKSTLIHDVLYQQLAASERQTTGELSEGTVHPSTPTTGAPGTPIVRELEGEQWLDAVELVDQSPIGRTPRSNPVTYIRAFDPIRELFAALPESKKHGYAAGHFSFNIPGGRCDTCSGDGTVTVEMQFLADVELICEDCKGTRYKPEILAVRYHGKNIHDVLNLTVKEALGFFSGVPKLVDKLRVLEEVGLGYLRLGQSATTLSGGEAQRMKLAAHLQPQARDTLRKPDGSTIKRRSHTLYIFDEPTTGLHFDDVSKLLAAFKKLIDAGGSIVVIEHNLDVIKVADWVIDLGPEGGERGGEVVAVGTPEEIAANPRSYTGQWLRKVLVAPAIAL
jgi:excinuclease ABC subunit A